MHGRERRNLGVVLCYSIRPKLTLQEESWQTREKLVITHRVVVRARKAASIAVRLVKEQAIQSNLIATAAIRIAAEISNPTLVSTNGLAGGQASPTS